MERVQSVPEAGSPLPLQTSASEEIFVSRNIPNRKWVLGGGRGQWMKGKGKWYAQVSCSMAGTGQGSLWTILHSIPANKLAR